MIRSLLPSSTGTIKQLCSSYGIHMLHIYLPGAPAMREDRHGITCSKFVSGIVITNLDVCYNYNFEYVIPCRSARIAGAQGRYMCSICST